MRKCQLIAFACSAACVAVWAQAPAARAAAPDNNVATREQRRAELRSMLQAHRQWDASASAGDAVAVERHLTEQERAEIREQLRQQRLHKARVRP